MSLRIAVLGFSIAWISSSTTVAQRTLDPAWRAEGNQTLAGFGSGVSGAGDVNGDGYHDFLVAAYVYDHGQTDEGGVFVFHGSKEGPAKLPSWTAEVDQAYARLENAAAAGDVNRDGYADVVIGAASFSNGQYLEGKAFLYLGSASGLATSPAWSAEGNEQAAYFGAPVAGAGDVNGDGFDDVVVGALLGDISHTPQGEGAAFLYLGSAAGLSASPAWSARGSQQFSGFGNARSAGDVNGDGYDDLVIGASLMNRGERDEGRVFVYLGSPTGPSTSADWTVEGDQENALLGSSVGAAGDVNGDGYDDLIVGAPGIQSVLNPPRIAVNGRVTVHLGSSAGLSTTPAWTMFADQVGSGFGQVAGAGDLNGDGFDDVLIGAPSYNHGERDEGRVFAFSGSPLGLQMKASWSAESNQRNSLFGYALAGAGDVNGDGVHDVIVGAYQFDAGQTNEGCAFLYLGSSSHRLR